MEENLCWKVARINNLKMKIIETRNQMDACLEKIEEFKRKRELIQMEL